MEAQGKTNSCGVRTGWHVSVKNALLLGFLAVAAVAVAAVLAYYIGISNYDCPEGQASETVRQVTGSSTKSSQQKTSGAPDQSKTSQAPAKKIIDVRLPLHLMPIKYRVKLIPFIIPDNFTIDGSVAILMEAKQGGSRNVTVHSAEIDIRHSSVKVAEVSEDGEKVIKELPVSGYKFDKAREFYIVELRDQIKKGRFYKLSMKFTSILNDKLKGLYRSSYKNRKTNKMEYMAVTQFQPTDARRAFPCFDEPAIKAKFEVSLGRLWDMTSISNMPIKQGGRGDPMDVEGDYLWDHYEESVPMSTYLVAFVVSNFAFEVSPKTGNGVKFRIWARKDALDQIAYAKDVGPKMLQYFEGYFNISYPLPKQDMIAIPDFAAGAMENWGLITYRETALLYKPGVSAARNLQRIAVVISHELAHQWFGNLVTPSWWTDLWLNEGFASYMEYLGVQAVQPDLKLLEQFVIVDLQRIFQVDALDTSHPISIPVKHPDEINEIFDGISYSKGASIIRMMDKFLSEDTFRGGLSNFLSSLAYKAAEQDDLWHYLTMKAHEDGKLPRDLTVKTVMDTWTLQMGFPVVTVNRKYDSKNTAELRQDRFLVSGKAKSNKGHNYMWWIPITYAEPGIWNFDNTYNKVWMSDKEKTKVVRDLPGGRNVPVIFNVQQSGYYRVNYDERNWRMIVDQLKQDHTKIHVINRAQIIDDALNLARVGLLDYELALDVTSYLKNEKEYIPWAAALGNLKYVKNMLERTPAYGAFKGYIGRLILPLFNRVGFESKRDDEHLDIFLRILAVSWSCNTVGDSECTDKVRALYRNWMGKPNPDDERQNPIDVNLKYSVYCNAIAKGGEEEWDFAWERYIASNVASEKSAILSGLACAEEVWLLNRFLNKSLTEGSGVRKADGQKVIANVASNIVGRDLTFDFIRDKWDRVVENYGSTAFALNGLMKNVLGNRNTEFALNEIKVFQKNNAESLSSAQREVAQAIEKTEANLKWMDKNYDAIFSWLSKQN